jgi:PAS domain S-box-containing protein
VSRGRQEPGSTGDRVEPSLRPLAQSGISDEELRAIVDAAPDALVMVDEGGSILLVNRQAEELFGYHRSELLGLPVETLLPESAREVHRARRAGYEAAPRTRPMGSGLQLLARRRDGREFPVEISLSPHYHDRQLRVVAAVRDVTARVAAEARLRQTAQELHQLEDRERIARDLHDVVIQRLFAAGMALQATQSIADDDDVSHRLEGVVDEIDETIREIRAAIFELQTVPEQRAGLRKDILTIVAEERLVLGFDPHVVLEGPVDSVSDDVAAALLPTIREALSNIGRHAHADAAEVRISVDERALLLRVEDDGVGIGDNRPAGLGLPNMARRAQALGGWYQIQRGGEGGTLLLWTVPND